MVGAFGPGRIGGFDHLPEATKLKELARTRSTVRELLATPRSEFPSVSVVYGGREVSEVAVDRAWTMARMRLRQHGGDVLEELARQLAVALADEATRRKRLEPMATLTSDGARKVGELQKAGLPHDRPLIAPLVLVPVRNSDA
ncbi:hypothetical protein ACFQY5_41280 [Paeniroseomonas aquatica]|uniref:Uncharacterized protein n=1 Tax=Paeniroseomonas aquatica TaxID=373043 RepID=A0ABT8AG10_9PROT|nr:hypothetical protein [Paeniroseomonas aquatica]MDN3568665.1 hypothetical protein [Paeniroseomonas aquatica]